MKNPEKSQLYVGAQAVPVANIRPNPRNPRRLTLNGPGGAASVAEMVRSIEANGLEEPVLVRLLEDTPMAGAFYQLIAGERRWRAYRQMGRETIPARVLEADEAEAAMKCLVTFLQAKGAGPMEEAQGYRDALDMTDRQGRPYFTPAQVAERTGKTVDRVRRMVLLCALPEFAQQAVMRGELTETNAWLIARLPDAGSREECAKEALRLGLTKQGLESLMAERWLRDLRGAAGLFDRKDATLLPEAGSCEVCPHRTGANPERFGECTGPAAQVCTKPECFRAKVTAARAAKAAKLQKEGFKVLGVDECEREYPVGMKALRLESPYVRLDAEVPPDLLKKEVAAHRGVTWEELLDTAKAKPVLYAGFNQAGGVEHLVKWKEAVSAVDAATEDRHIFRESDRAAARPGVAAVVVPAVDKSPRDSAHKATSLSAGEDPEKVQLRYELSVANGLLVQIDQHLRQREIKLPAKVEIALDAYLVRMDLSEGGGS